MLNIVKISEKTPFCKLTEKLTDESNTVWYAIWDYHIKVKVKLSFGHKAVISSLSKLNTESKNFFYKSCSVWYTIWKSHIRSES